MKTSKYTHRKLSVFIISLAMALSAHAVTDSTGVVPLRGNPQLNCESPFLAELCSKLVSPGTPAGGSQCGASRFDANILISYCQGHNPLYSCPSGYKQAAIGWRAGGIYTCMVTDPTIDDKTCPTGFAYAGDERQPSGVYRVTCGKTQLISSYAVDACIISTRTRYLTVDKAAVLISDVTSDAFTDTCYVPPPPDTGGSGNN